MLTLIRAFLARRQRMRPHDLADARAAAPHPFPARPAHTSAARPSDEILELRERLAKIVDSSDDAILSKDLNGIVLTWNRGAERMYGYSAEMIVGRSISTLMPEDRWNEMSEILDRIKRGEGVQRYETIRRRKDGRPIHVSLSVSPLLDAHGKITGASIIARDTTEQKRLQELTRESEERYRSLVAATTSVVWTADPTGQFVSPQPSWEAFTGQSWDEAKGWGWIAALHPDDRQKFTEVWQEVVATRQVLLADARLWHASKQQYHHVVVRAVPLSAVDGSVREWVGTITDVHSQKSAEIELRRSQQQLQDFVENASVGLHWVGPDGRILWANKAELDMLGYARDEYVGHHLSEFHDDQATMRDILSRLGRAEVLQNYEATLRCKNGSIRHVLINSNVLWEEGKFVHTRCFTRDITERKTAEDRVRGLNADLERRAAELEAANRQLEAFSYSISHDLRAPLRAISGFATLLTDEHAGRLDDEGKRLLQVIRGNATRMDQLIDSLLSFSRLSQLAIERKPVDMAGLANEIVDEVRRGEPAGGAPHQVHIGELPQAEGDATMLRQVLTNLIANAFKFSRRAEQPAVRITGTRKQQETVYTISDNGVGFDMRYLDRLFRVFERLHGDDVFEGTGVGLAIVQRIVHGHGGRVWAEAEVGQGATFHFSLPNSLALPAQSPTPVQPVGQVPVKLDA
jgi:PAS domain S-box-containing protein